MSSKTMKQIPGSNSSPSERSGVRIKICGMKHSSNITEVAALQPDYLGFIFYEKSSRFFKGNIPELPKETKKVGVFVNASIEEILEKAALYTLDMVQLHGEESPEFCDQLKTHLGKTCDITKVFSIKDHFNFDQLQPYQLACDYFLFDTKGQLPGGNGYTFNWDVLRNYPSTKPYFLSGGIGLDEVENLTEFLNGDASRYCYAIDINSKLESEPGLKDLKLLKEFKNRIKSNLTGFENL